MPIAGKPLDHITEQDLLDLIQNGIQEDKTLEYKQELKLQRDGDKKEFLADVSAMANAAGGDLVFGMTEQDGIPEELIGLAGVNIDQEKLRIENLLASGIKPRIPNVNICGLLLSSGDPVILIRIPRSWVAPHMVTIQGHNKFYGRHSAGKYLLDVDDIRQSVLGTEALGEKIRSYRADRIAQILAAETPILLAGDRFILLHLIPVDAFAPGIRYHLKDPASSSYPPPLFHTGYNHRINADGVLLYDPVEEGKMGSAYLQIFRNGILEGVDADFLEADQSIASLAFERYLVQAIGDYLGYMATLGVGQPIYALLSLLNVRGFSMSAEGRWKGRRGSINRDHLLVPEVEIESIDSDAPLKIKEAIDMVWQASGWPASIHYDEQGNWLGALPPY